MKKIKPEDLVIRDSMLLAFRGCELWCIELDSLNYYTSIAMDKFLKDMELTRRPSYPGLIAIHLNGTLVDRELAKVVVNELKEAGNAVYKVAFIGLNYSGKKMIRNNIKNMDITFHYHFNNDYEKAKEWLAAK